MTTPIDVTDRAPADHAIGDGFLLSDDDLGFTGIRVAQGRLPFYDLRADAFTFKVSRVIPSPAQTTAADIYGLQITKPYRERALLELDVADPARMRRAMPIYVRPFGKCRMTEWIARGFRIFSATSITRNFIDGRVEGRFLEGGFYKRGMALQNGNVDRSSPTLSSVQLGGYAFLMSAGLYARTQ